MLVGGHDPLDIDPVVAAVGVHAHPVLRRAVGLVVPRPGGIPVIPDVVLAVLPQPHAGLHLLPPLFRAFPVDGLLRDVVHRDQPIRDEVLLVGGMREAICLPALIALGPFSRFRVDAEREILFRDGESLALPPKAFQLLLVLIRHNQEVVTKDDLMQEVWPDSFVEEANLTNASETLRQFKASRTMPGGGGSDVME